MEAQAQPIIERFTISKDFFLEDEEEATCPFCGTILAQTEIDFFYCHNPVCPYSTQEPVRDVVDALLDQGRDLLSAAQLAAKYTVEQIEETDPVTPERFAVTDETSANWVLKKLAFYESRRATMQAMVDNELESIQQRGREITDPLDRQIEFFRQAFGDQMRTWAEGAIVGQKTRSIKLLHGTAGFRKSPERLDVADEARAIEKAEELGLVDLVRVRKELSKTATKEYIRDLPSSPMAEMVTIEPGEDVFYIKAELPGG